MTKKVVESFIKEYLHKPHYIYKAPARIELIGNHTDHNGGLAIVSTVNLYMVGAFSKRNDKILDIYSTKLGRIIFSMEEAYVLEDRGSLKGIIKGILDQISTEKLTGLNILIDSEIPIGAGLSSSAALETLLVCAFNDIYNLNLSKDDCIKIAHKSETDYFGKDCGLLDQTAIVKGSMLMLDFSSQGLVSSKINPDFDNYQVVVVDTDTDHSNLSYAYNEISKDMREVASYFGKKKLGSVNKDDFYNCLPSLSKEFSGLKIMRAIHFFEENNRVNQFVNNCKNTSKLLKLINESGLSSSLYLQNIYLPSDKNQEMSLALALLRKSIKKGAVRIHGGGFAGSILCLINKEDLERFNLEIEKYFTKDKIYNLELTQVGVSREY